MGNTIQPGQSLRASSQTPQHNAQDIHPANKTGSTGARTALAHARCGVGDGTNREKAQSAGTSIKGLLTSLSNALNSVLHNPERLAKALPSYTMRPSGAESDLSPKKAMGPMPLEVGDAVTHIQAAVKNLAKDR